MAELQEPELTDAAEAGNGQSGPSGQSQAAERRLAVAGHCAARGPQKDSSPCLALPAVFCLVRLCGLLRHGG